MRPSLMLTRSKSLEPASSIGVRNKKNIKNHKNFFYGVWVKFDNCTKYCTKINKDAWSNFSFLWLWW